MHETKQDKAPDTSKWPMKPLSMGFSNRDDTSGPMIENRDEPSLVQLVWEKLEN